MKMKRIVKFLENHTIESEVRKAPEFALSVGSASTASHSTVIRKVYYPHKTRPVVKLHGLISDNLNSTGKYRSH